MRIYSNVLTRFDLRLQLADMPDVIIESARSFVPRGAEFSRGFEVYLEGIGDHHKRGRNTRPGHAATWDEYGIWIDRLFDIDPDAKIAYYNGHDDFIDQTSRYQPRGAKAPWLTEDVRLVA